ncbi:ketoacyl-ACP synthase III [Flavobacteriales bacterium]|nr:ketoacyl-ACP synthase III [Flavobacteriales bacterium]
MSFIGGVRVSGIAAAVPEKRLIIDNLNNYSTSEKKQFIRHVGVYEKRTSDLKLTTADLCLAAAEELLQDLGWAPNTVGALILVTQSPDQLLPSTAIVLQNKLGLAESCLAFDINLGCSGWVYGLSVVGSLMKTLGIERGLLLAGETAVLTTEDNHSHFPLMGDAGTATALELSKGATPMRFQFYSDGGRFQAIHAPNSGARQFADGGSEADLKYVAQMEADQVLRFCLLDVIPSIRNFMKKSDVNIDAVSYFVFHQANRLINESMRKKLSIPEEKFPYSISHFGNTSSASIPLTMVTQLSEQMASEQTLLCSGFGVGLSMAHVVLKTKHVKCLPLIEMKVPTQ